MNKLSMIIMAAMILGLSAPNVWANGPMHEKNNNIEYNELSAAEFFYGVPTENMNGNIEANGNADSFVTAGSTKTADFLPASEFFYGYSIPNRLGTTTHFCTWDRTDAGNAVNEVSDPALFFGYTVTGS